MYKSHSCIDQSKVVDSRQLSGNLKGKGVRRRRECLMCHKRFTTHEVEVNTILTEIEQLEHKKSMQSIIKSFELQIKKFKIRVEDL